jgi:hypothetical protein
MSGSGKRPENRLLTRSDLEGLSSAIESGRVVFVQKYPRTCGRLGFAWSEQANYLGRDISIYPKGYRYSTDLLDPAIPYLSLYIFLLKGDLERDDRAHYHSRDCRER